MTSSPNLLDRVISAFSPERGLRRVQARAAIDRVTAYAAGRNTPRTRYWRAAQSGPNAEIGPALATLRARSRQMVRDNPYAARAVMLIANQTVGTGIKARFKDPRAQALWDAWCKQCDIAGVSDLAGLQLQAARTRSEGGEALVRLVPVTAARQRALGLNVPLQIEVLEGDMLPEDTSTFLDSRIPRGGRVVHGVEFDANGRRTAYFLRRDHPGEIPVTLTSSTEVDRVPADQVLHLYRVQRPGQVRGVPDGASTLLRLRFLDDYEDTALAQANAQALLGVFFTQPEAADVQAPLGPDGQEPEIPSFDLRPGMTQTLPPGYEPKFLQPSGAGAFDPLAKHQLRAIAAGYGMPVQMLTGDYSGANFSTLRSGRIDWRKMIEVDQWGLFVPRMCEPIKDAFLRAAIASGALEPDDYAVEWGPPRMEMTDPTQEIPAIRDAMRVGALTWAQMCVEMGEDPEKQLAEIQEWNRKADQAGVILDCDPRRTSLSGGAQDAAQNAAVQLGANGRVGTAQPQSGDPP